MGELLALHCQGVFPTAGHLCSWARVAPRVKESGGRRKGGSATGKGNPYIGATLGEASAAVGRTQTFLGAKLRRLVRHMPKKKAQGVSMMLDNIGHYSAQIAVLDEKIAELCRPSQVDGFARSLNLENQMNVETLRQSTMEDSAGQAKNLVSAVYQKVSAPSGTDQQVVMFVGGNLAGADPSASVANFEHNYLGVTGVPAGELGGGAACGETETGGKNAAICMWFDNDSFGALVSPTMTTAKLAATLITVRPSLELSAK